MRIAIVSREVLPFFGAGIGAYAAAMARAWQAAGHETHFLSEGHRGFAERGPAELGGARCHIIAPVGPGYTFARHAEEVRRELRRLHSDHPFDYIEFPDYWAEGYDTLRARRLEGELAGAVLGVRLHTPTHECRALNGETGAGPEVATLERREDAAIRAADVVISPSRSLLDIVHARLHLSAPSAVVPYPFRLHAETTPAAPTRRPTILYFGRLERRKGVELLVEAGQRLLDRGVDVDIRFIGGDTRTGPGGASMLDHLRARIADRWRERVSFEPRRPRAEVLGMVRAVAAGGGVCCFPSLWENFPNVCLEAMALGAPVIGSDAGGMSEIIEDGVSGVLFRSGDAASLEAALARVLGDEALRTAIGAGGPARVAHLCRPPDVVQQTIAAIESARRSPGFGRRRGFDEVPMPAVPVGVRLRRFAAKWLHVR